MPPEQPAPAAAYSHLRRPAVDVLRANDEGRYTVPSRRTYPHQWNWDSALCALGWTELEPARAWRELEALAAARDGDGMFPHIAFRTLLGELMRVPAAGARLAWPGARYLPGPRWWGRRRGADGRRITGITQPPVAATAMRVLFERRPDEPSARALLHPLLDWHRFLLERRDPLGHGEPTIVHPWETGRDNAVEWDAPLARVVPRVTVVRRRDTLAVDAVQRPSDDHYRRFLTLVLIGTQGGWQQERLARGGAFRVLDPGFSAILARACQDLAWVAERLGEPAVAEESAAAAARVAGALRRRAGSDGLLRPVDLVADETIEVTGAGSALAVLAPGLAPQQVAAVRDLALSGELASAYGVASLARGHPKRSTRCYWRGPAWANVTWLCAHGLELHREREAAEGLRLRMLAAVEGGGMREYFVPDSGRGLGARDFGWTAALTLDALGRRSRLAAQAAA